MKRREFMALLGSAVAAWPLAARAQQAERMRRIGVLLVLAEGDPEAQRRIAIIQKGLETFGWIDARNIRSNFGWTAGAPDRLRPHEKRLVRLTPDVILPVPLWHWRHSIAKRARCPSFSLR